MRMYIPFIAFILTFNLFTYSTTKVTHFNFKEEHNSLNLNIIGTEKINYRIREYTSPPHIVIKITDAEYNLPYDKLPINKGPVLDVKIKKMKEVEGDNEVNNIYVTVNLIRSPEWDFQLSKDGKIFTLQIKSPEITIEKKPTKGKQAKKEKEEGPFKKLPSPTIRTEEREEETEKLYECNPIINQNFIDATPSEVVAGLAKQSGCNIIIDSKIIEEFTPATQEKGTTTGMKGLTINLQNITLKEALDIITISQGWEWVYRSGSYIILSKETAEKGLSPVSLSAPSRTTEKIDSKLFKANYLNVCDRQTYLFISNMLYGLFSSSYCDPNSNTLTIVGFPDKLAEAIKKLKEIDTPQYAERESSYQKDKAYRTIEEEFITKVIDLKYIRAEDLSSKLKDCLNNPYFGNLTLYGLDSSAGKDIERSSDNTLTYDKTTNSLIFVGRKKIYARLIEVIQQLDVPSKANIIEIIPLRYARATDLKQSGIIESALERSGEGEGAGGKGGGGITRLPIQYNESTNTIIFIGTRDDYERVLQIIKSLDIEDVEVISEIVPLQYVRVEDLKASKLLEESLKTPEFGSGDIEKAKTIFNYDSNTNSVIITAQKQYTKKIKDFLKKLDVEINDVETKTFKLKHIGAERANQLVLQMLPFGEEIDSVPSDGSFWPGVTLEENTTTFDSTYSKSSKTKYEPQPTSFYDSTTFRTYAETTQNMLIVRATKRIMKIVEELIGKIDIPYPLIKIDVQVVELRKSDQKNIGLGYYYQKGRIGGNINYTKQPTYTGNNQYQPVPDKDAWIITGGDPTNPQYTLRDPYDLLTTSGFFLYDTAEHFVKQFSTSLHALITENVGKILANPSVITRENVPASFDFTDKIPFITYTYDQYGKLVPTVKYAENGIKLTLLTHFTEDGNIVIKLNPLSADSLKDFTDAGIPITGTRRIDTETSLRDGEPLIIGGLLQSIDIEKIEKVPFLSSLPLFGNLFKKKQNTKEEFEIIVIITPTIIKQQS